MKNQATTVDEYLTALPEWQKQNLMAFRAIIHKVAPNITEEIKWNVPTFLVNKTILFAMSAFKAHTKYNFILNGALLTDEHSLFNNGLDSKNARAIDMREGEAINSAWLEAIVREAYGSTQLQ